MRISQYVYLGHEKGTILINWCNETFRYHILVVPYKRKIHFISSLSPFRCVRPLVGSSVHP